MSTDTSRYLRSGKLSLLLENGFARYITWGGLEILRMVYYAVRDENWGTIPQVIENVKIHEGDNTFEVRYGAHTQHPTIDFRWYCRIKGRRDTFTFDIQGEAHSDFYRNRIGFCVLHPIAPCKGKAVGIAHPNGTVSQHQFPGFISPHQPFKNSTGMQWDVENVQATLRFKGDLFETEDQRNWLDASYKTYGTPLDLPFPVAVKKGDKVQQRVHLHIQGERHQEDDRQGDLVLRLGKKRFPLPSFGLEANAEKLGALAIEKLKRLPLGHLRVTVRLRNTAWETALEQRLQQATVLGLPVELVVFPYQNEHQKLLGYHWEGISLVSIVILADTEKVMPRTRLEGILPDFRKAFPHTPIGTGTDFYFTELNRNRPSTEGVDFLVFSCNPQVHAFDDRSIVETAATFADVVATAHSFAAGLPIHVSPITLKPRSNPDATATISREQQRFNRMDVRQRETLTALWFLASFKNLTVAAAEQLTFFQTVGEEGVMMPNRDSVFPAFPAKANKTFPVYEAMKLLGNYSTAHLRESVGNNPLIFEGLVFDTNDGTEAILLNFTNAPINVQVGTARFKVPRKGWRVVDLGSNATLSRKSGP